MTAIQDSPCSIARQGEQHASELPDTATSQDSSAPTGSRDDASTAPTPAIRDQADELRQLVRETAPRPKAAGGKPATSIAFASGKGGVGTTTLAVNTAIGLAVAGHRILLVDGDINGADAAALAGVDPRYSLPDVLVGRRSLRATLEPGPHGMQVLGGPWGTGPGSDYSPASLDRLLSQIDAAKVDFDFVVIDVGTGLHQLARRFWQSSDHVVVVTTPETAAVMDCYAAMKVMLAGTDPSASLLRCVINHAPNQTIADGVEERLSRACRLFMGRRFESLGFIPSDPVAAGSGAARKPFITQSPDSHTSEAIRQLIQQIQQLGVATTDAA